LLHFPRGVQPAIGALWAIDEAMGAAIAGASQPALAGIKLAWWREALARLARHQRP
jgi:phytoene synthase